jgi:hypothetical protein
VLKAGCGEDGFLPLTDMGCVDVFLPNVDVGLDVA